MADGVDLGKGTVTIKIRPGALRVITAEKGPGLEDQQKKSTETIVPEPGSSTVGEDHHEETVILLG
jgi:hypothetical protein